MKRRPAKYWLDYYAKKGLEVPPELRQIAEAEAAGGNKAGAGRRKHNNKAVEVDGILYPSKLEFHIHRALVEAFRGERNVLRQTELPLSPGRCIRPDFLAIEERESDSRFVGRLFDAKGREVIDFTVKAEWLLSKTGLEIRRLRKRADAALACLEDHPPAQPPEDGSRPASPVVFGPAVLFDEGRDAETDKRWTKTIRFSELAVLDLLPGGRFRGEWRQREAEIAPKWTELENAFEAKHGFRAFHVSGVAATAASKGGTVQQRRVSLANNERVLARLKALQAARPGAWLTASRRDLMAALSLGRSPVDRALSELAAQGKIRLRAQGAGKADWIKVVK